MNKVVKLNIDNLHHNLNYFKETTQKEVFPVVKANAYGHGDVEIVQALNKMDVKVICVASIDEAKRIVSYTDKDILIFGYTSLDSIEKDHHPQFIYTWGNDVNYESLTDPVRFHIEVNTGMNRFGFKDMDSIKKTLKTKHKIEGIYTHFSSSDSSKKETERQLHIFEEIVHNLNFQFEYIHASNTSGATYVDSDLLNASRVGLGLYGLIEPLKPVLSLYGKIVHIDTIHKGETVGYNQTFQSQKTMKFGMVPIGYADGLDMRQTTLPIYINQKPFPILGKICMDQMMVAVDDTVRLGDWVEIIGPNRSIKIIADTIGVIPYVVCTGLSERLKKKL